MKIHFQVNAIRLQGVEHVISLTVTDDNTVLFRSYKIHLKKSGLKTPRIELAEIGKYQTIACPNKQVRGPDLLSN